MLNLGEDEGKIDALAGSLEDAAIKSFEHSSELHTKLVSSLNQSSLLQSNRVKEFLDGERGGGTIITGELSPLQKEALERSMSPEQMESLGLARNILKNMMDAGAVQVSAQIVCGVRCFLTVTSLLLNYSKCWWGSLLGTPHYS